MTEEKSQDQSEEKVKVVFEDPEAKENVPSTTAVAQEKYLDEQVDFDRKIDPGATRPLEEEGFVGVDPEYRNYASVAGQPFFAEGGVEERLETYALGEPEDEDESESDEGVEPEEDEDEVPETGGDETKTEEPKSSDTPAPPAGSVSSSS